MGRAASGRPPSAGEAAAGLGSVPRSLLNLPLAPLGADVPAVDIVVSGVPFDGGTTYRPGARFGPQAVREASVLARSFSAALGIDVFEELRALDGGDVLGASPDVRETVAAVAARAEALARSGVIGAFVGGDQTLTLGALRGIRQAKHKAIGLVHFDAHPNTAAATPALPVHHTSVVRNAIEEGLVRSDAALQIGVRGPYTSAEEASFASARGFEVAGIDDIRRDLHGVVGRVRGLVGRGPLYVSVDVSVLDPSVAPGTGCPSPGGMTTWELQQLLRALVGADVIGFDVVEVAPTYDPAGITAHTAVTILHEIFAVIADTRRSARPAPSTRRVSSRAGKLSP